MAALSSCSTQKNTALSRSYHSTKVKYNIYYNGDVAYQEGLQQQAKTLTDDYSQVLYLYPVSDHKAAEASKSKMDRTIEKCRKCIKLHSIKKRPKTNAKKMHDPKYKAWLKQEEFNPSMHLAWLRLGQAEFQKGDFLGSVSTFGYVMRHFDYDKDLVAQCQLWQVRAYAEMGWLYEAEDLLRKVQIDDLSRKHASLYSAVSADLLLKQKRYHEAIPHVKIAKQDEDRKTSRPRFEYVLAQLYELEGNRSDAEAAYRRVLKLTPEWSMDFNARLRLFQLQSNGSAKKQLEKMIRRPKYKEYLDQLYGALGNIYLEEGDTLQALEQYRLAGEKSTKNGPEKAAILIKAGDLYFDRTDYVNAEPCYTEATTILSSEDAEYERVKKRQEVLGELVQHVQQVELQDSLQHLATLSEEEQMAVVEKLIAALVEQEAKDSIARAEAEREEANGGSGLRSVNTANMLGGPGGSGEWYFYNPNLMKQGKQAFRQKWGARTLEDNWRRKNKAGSFIAAETPTPDEEDEDSIAEGGDTIPEKAPEPVTDVKDPQYYLQQIPKTPEDIAASDTLIAESLYQLVLIYQDRLEDEELAAATFDELKRRFPNDSRLADLYYQQYLNSLKRDNQEAAAEYRDIILAQYPTSAYAQVVADPDYFEKLRVAQAASDSLYAETYTAFRQSDYSTVKQKVTAAEEQYPLSPLMPRFLFLRSIAIAKTENQDAFAESLRDLIRRYPTSDISSMGKDMLAMMNQGLESQTGGSTSSLSDKRLQQQEEEMAEDSVSQEVERIPQVVITLPQSTEKLNKLLYEVALYNFSQFMIKDFDLDAQPTYSADRSALIITGFDSEDDVEWYKGLLRESESLQAALTTLEAKIE